MRLNLGCGNIRFKIDRDDGYARPYSYAMPESCYDADDWVNVDRMKSPAVDQVVDLFDLPWPWADNSVDEIWCSHLCEHIPHDLDMRHIKDVPLDSPLDKCIKVDGWYAFFYEVWRVLKPDASIWVMVPYAFSRGAMGEPTHHRYLVPETFTYFEFNRDGDGMYDGYDLPYLLRLTGQVLWGLRSPRSIALTEGLNKWLSEHEWDRQILGHVNTVDEFCIQLQAVK